MLCTTAVVNCRLRACLTLDDDQVSAACPVFTTIKSEKAEINEDRGL